MGSARLTPAHSSSRRMEGQDYLAEYRNISNKLKKRFLRRPNVSEASEQFRGLAKRLEDNEEPQYAAYCHLATGRCEATVGNHPGEIEAVTAAARNFLKSEIQVQTLKNPSFEFQLTSAVSCYSQAAKLQEDQGRPQLAGSLNMELANALWDLRKPREALHYYKRAADLFDKDILDVIQAKLKMVACHIKTMDFHNALLVLSEVANIAEQDEPLQLLSVLENIEILRVILLLIIEPSSHNTSPHLLNVLEKYRNAEDDLDLDKPISPYLTMEMSDLLQSLVMATDSINTESLLYLEDELYSHLTDQQRGVLRVLVSQTIKKV